MPPPPARVRRPAQQSPPWLRPGPAQMGPHDGPSVTAMAPTPASAVESRNPRHALAKNGCADSTSRTISGRGCRQGSSDLTSIDHADGRVVIRRGGSTRRDAAQHASSRKRHLKVIACGVAARRPSSAVAARRRVVVRRAGLRPASSRTRYVWLLRAALQEQVRRSAQAWRWRDVSATAPSCVARKSRFSPRATPVPDQFA